MANLDRFSQPIREEREPQKVCNCEHCNEELFEGEWHFKTDEYIFCDKSCFIDWATEEFSGDSRILEGNE